MSTSKHVNKICVAVVAFMLILTLLFMNGEALGITSVTRDVKYASTIFDTSYVHKIDIVMNDWESFIESCENEEYASCTVVVDGKKHANIAIRAKGNTSLSSVSSMGSQRYSFKLEFDHYENGKSLDGLDKLCLNNLIQDNTMMKDYLVYQMMSDFGVDSPLCSYAYLTVNGEDWGLYLAVEGIEESFLSRTYGTDAGDLYKPDSMSFGGGRGNGRGFNMPGAIAFGGGGFGNDDVKLKYIDDDPDSYPNIFDNAKTDVSKSDQKRLIQSLEKLSSYTDLESVLDTEEVLRYFVVHNFVCNGDSYTGSMIHNYYLHESDGQLAMIPWDYNLAYGTFQGGSATSSVNASIDSPVSNGSVDDRPMLGWIFSDESYTERYHQLFSEFLEKWFANGELEQMIAQTAEMIRPYVEKDPTKFCTTEEFDTGVETITQFVSLRAEAVSNQLQGDTTTVDASSLNTSLMGSMGGGMGRSEGRSDKEQGSRPDQSQGDQPSQPSTDQEGSQEWKWTRPDQSGEQQTEPGQEQESRQGEPESEQSGEEWTTPDFSGGQGSFPFPGQSGDPGSFTFPSGGQGDFPFSGESGSGSMPGFSSGGSAETTFWILTGISMAVLAAGLVVARKLFK